SVNPRFHVAVVRKRGLGNLDDEENVGRPGKTRGVEIWLRPQQDDIGLRLTELVEPHGPLHLHDSVVANSCDQRTSGAIHSRVVTRSDWSHGDDLAIDELDAVVFGEDAGLRLAVVV